MNKSATSLPHAWDTRDPHMHTSIPSSAHDVLYAEKCENVPLIDFGLLSEGDNGEIKKLVMAAKTWGFLQVVNHGVSRDLLREIEAQACHVFALPLEAKTRAAESPDSGIFHGYLAKSEGNVSRMPSSEAVRIPLNPQQRHDLITKLWPNGNERFSSAVEHYIAAVELISLQLLKNLASAIGLNPLHFIQNVSKDGHSSVLRMNFYPSISKSQSYSNPTLGLVAHTDPQLMTILYQNGIDGLQIFKDKKWIAASLRPGSFTINVGDLLQVLSNDVYKSVLHRVVMNTNVFRLSLVYGVGLHPKAIVRPAAQLVTAQQPPHYRPFTSDEYFMSYASHREYGNTHLDMFRELYQAVGYI